MEKRLNEKMENLSFFMMMKSFFLGVSGFWSQLLSGFDFDYFTWNTSRRNHFYGGLEDDLPVKTHLKYTISSSVFLNSKKEETRSCKGRPFPSFNESKNSFKNIHN